MIRLLVYLFVIQIYKKLSFQLYKKHYGDRDSTKKLQSFISIVVP